jgi:hypothetical protein|tara:strand:+ start:1182 stop:1370 length:189 start_codon:yes stop_codon:yes gene_type:complete
MTREKDTYEHTAMVLVDEKKNKVIIEIDSFDNNEDAYSFAKFIVAALDLKLISPKNIGETTH